MTLKNTMKIIESSRQIVSCHAQSSFKNIDGHPPLMNRNHQQQHPPRTKLKKSFDLSINQKEHTVYPDQTSANTNHYMPPTIDSMYHHRRKWFTINSPTTAIHHNMSSRLITENHHSSLSNCKNNHR